MHQKLLRQAEAGHYRFYDVNVTLKLTDAHTYWSWTLNLSVFFNFMLLAVGNQCRLTFLLVSLEIKPLLFWIFYFFFVRFKLLHSVFMKPWIVHTSRIFNSDQVKHSPWPGVTCVLWPPDKSWYFSELLFHNYDLAFVMWDDFVIRLFY